VDYSNHGVEVKRSVDTVSHYHPHPNGTPAHASWAPEQTLHVAVAYSNPFRWKTRIRLFNDFRRHVTALPNVRLYVGELAYGDRPFEVTSAGNPDDLQLRTNHELWHKENILNAVINRFDHTWRYGAYIDGDFTLTRYDVALETIHMLQHHAWVQMFTTYCDLSHDHKPLRILKSFGSRFVSGELTPEVLSRIQKGIPATEGLYYGGAMGSQVIKNRGGIGTTGAAWAWRRDAFNACGGLLDTCILGSGDWHMAFGLAGEPDIHPNVREMNSVGQRYTESIKIWQSRAARYVNKNVGCVDCHAIHHFHGSKVLRKYEHRWKILRDWDYDPYVDIFKDYQGIYQLNQSKPGLRDAIRDYFKSRNEDDISLREGDTQMGN
jgi:hypothetical protein